MNQPTSAYLAKQESKERSVVCGDQSLTIGPKDSQTRSCTDKSEVHRLTEENRHLQEKISDLTTQLSLAEASMDKPLTAQSAPSLVAAEDAGSIEVRR